MTNEIKTLAELTAEIAAVENRAVTYTSLTEMKRIAARRQIKLDKNVKVDALRAQLLELDKIESDALIAAHVAALAESEKPVVIVEPAVVVETVAAPAVERDPNAPVTRLPIVRIAGRRALRPGYEIAVIEDQTTNGVEIYYLGQHAGSFNCVADALKGLGKHSPRYAAEGFEVSQKNGQYWLYKKVGNALQPIDENGKNAVEFSESHMHVLHIGNAEIATHRIAGTLASVTNCKEVDLLVKNAAVERPSLRKTAPANPDLAPDAEKAFKFGDVIIRAKSLAQARKLFLDSLTVEVVVETAPVAPEVAPEPAPAVESAPVTETK